MKVIFIILKNSKFRKIFLLNKNISKLENHNYNNMKYYMNNNII